MVGRELRTICPVGEDHPGLLHEVGVGMHGEKNTSPGEGDTLMWQTRAMMMTENIASILILPHSSRGLLTHLLGKISQAMNWFLLDMTWER